MTNHAVVNVGGGPTGLMLAAELALAWIDVVTSSDGPTRRSKARARGACTRARSKCSTSEASRGGSSRRGRPLG